jgi:hypothetical protein
MTAGFYVVNYTRYDTEFHRVIESMSIPVFIVFFTGVGVSLDLQVLTSSWSIILVLVAVRFAGMYLGSLVGGIAARDPMKHNLLSGLAYLTQAGVSVGLAKEVAVEFSPWGPDLATLSIGVIVVNQLIGPPFFKWVLGKTGEARTRADDPAFDGTRDAVIFGLDTQSMALARQLQGHGWTTRIICCDAETAIEPENEDVEIILDESELSVESMKKFGVGKADAIVALLTDEQNYRLCELNYEHFGVRDFIVLIKVRRLYTSWIKEARYIIHLINPDGIKKLSVEMSYRSLAL